MLSQTEKFSAIMREYPNIPFQELANVADKITTEQDVARVVSIVSAYIRHAKTLYDSMLRGEARSATLRTAVRYAIEPEVRLILHSWR